LTSIRKAGLDPLTRPTTDPAGPVVDSAHDLDLQGFSLAKDDLPGEREYGPPAVSLANRPLSTWPSRVISV